MKTKLLTILLVLASLCANAQFRRSSDHKIYPYTNSLLPTDVFVVGRIIPDTNYNYAVSNLLATMTNTAAYQAWLATNSYSPTVTNISIYLATNVGISSTVATNIAAYQAFLSTNNYASTVTNIANYLSSLTTNNFAPTNSGIAGQVLHVSVTGGATRWDYVNQAMTNTSSVRADFNMPVNKFTTNAAFLWLSPANVDTTGKKTQVTDVTVTNSTAAAVLATFAASVRVTGTPYITNETDFHWKVTPWRLLSYSRCLTLLSIG